MRARTEDLLTIRDGEAIDAALRERVAADPESAREVARLTRVAASLRRLPVLEPPAEVWERVAAEADPVRARRIGRAASRAGAAVAAAAIAAVTAVLLIGSPDSPDDSSDDGAIADAGRRTQRGLGLDREPGAGRDGGLDAAANNERVAGPNGGLAAGPNGGERVADYTPLVEESVRLERLLAELDRGPHLMSASTASTIADLEDRIVLLDDQLTYAEARDAEPRYRQALWRERVDVMNALLYVRYAQARQVPGALDAF